MCSFCYQLLTRTLGQKYSYTMKSILIISVITIVAASREGNLEKELVGQLAKRSIFQGKTAVAFSVRTKRAIPVSRVYKTIRFDEVLLNLGGGYNTASGVFVVPVSGIYLFTFNMRASNNDHGGWVHLMKNHRELAYAYDNHRGANSNQVIVRAVKGDHVFARLMPSYGLWGDRLHAYTSMSGILLIPG